MLFQVIHSHSEETCPGVFPDKLKTFSAWWNEMKSTAGIKVLGGYVSPIEHNFYITLEADDFGAVLLIAFQVQLLDELLAAQERHAASNYDSLGERGRGCRLGIVEQCFALF